MFNFYINYFCLLELLQLTYTLANFGATAQTRKGWSGSHDVYGQVAGVDDQGNAGFCTRYSLAKGATDGCDHLGIDLDQEAVAVALVNIHKDFEGKNPVAFNGAKLVIPGTDNESKKWYKMTISVEEIDLEYFKLTFDKKCGTFLLGTYKWGGGHCLYAVDWLPSEGKVKCLNSWGKGQEEEPLIDPGEILGMWRVSIRLEDMDTKIIKQTAWPLPDYPETFTLHGNAALWRCFVGGNSNRHSYYLGLYRRINLIKNGRPVWKLETAAHYHLFHVTRNHYLYYTGNKTKKWVFGNDYTVDRGHICSVSSGSLRIPSTGWKYIHGGYWKEEDPSLRVTTD